MHDSTHVEPRPTLLSLGDSFSCGEAVGVRLDVRQTWAGLLADAMGAHHEVLAVAGATTTQVRAVQMPLASARALCWVTLLAGLNDVFRREFDACRVSANLRMIVTDLRARHRGVLLVRLHDPSEILPIPARVRRTVRDRVAAMNDAIDAAAEGSIVVDLRTIDELQLREAWAVDRIHPSSYGHAAIACAAARAIARTETSWPSGTVHCAAAQTIPTRAAECRWVARHGVPWAARRAHMLGEVVTTMLIDRDRSVQSC